MRNNSNKRNYDAILKDLGFEPSEFEIVESMTS
jgi:hypothetical protein